MRSRLPSGDSVQAKAFSRTRSGSSGNMSVSMLARMLRQSKRRKSPPKELNGRLGSKSSMGGRSLAVGSL